MRTLVKRNRKKRDKPDYASRKTEAADNFLSTRIKKRRSCLMCGKMFHSNGPFNRRCSDCNRLVEVGKGRGIEMPHVYKVKSSALDDMLDRKDFIDVKE